MTRRNLPEPERRDATLATVLDMLRRDLLAALRKHITIRAVAKSSEAVTGTRVPSSTAHADWTTSDELFLQLAKEHLFSLEGSGVGETIHQVAVSYGGAGRPPERFAAAMATNFEQVRDNPATVPAWTLHLAAAGVVAYPERQAVAIDQCDRELADALAAVRIDYFEALKNRLLPLLRTVLTDTRRRPRDGETEDSLLTLLHVFFSGAVLRYLLDPHVLGDQPAQRVGAAMWVMLEGFTEPDPVIDDHDKDLPDRLRERAARVVLDHFRAGDGDAAGLGRAEVIEAVRTELELDEDAVASAFDEAFPELDCLWDAALRRYLALRVTAAAGSEERPAAVLNAIVADIFEFHAECPGLARLCVETRSTYQDELEASMASLLESCGKDPGDARILLQDALNGDHKHVEVIIRTAGGDKA